MRSHVLALAAAATLLVSLSARADEDPFADPPDDDLPPLPALSELPPLPELPPLDEAEPDPAPAPAPVHASAPPPEPPAAPAAVSIPATQSAVLGMYDEYRRSVGAFSIDFCGKDDEVARGGPTRNPRLRSWRPPGSHDATLGFRCAD